MMKVLLGITFASLLALFVSYLLIPQTIVFSKVIFLNSPVGGVERAFNNASERLKWWPKKFSDSNHIAGRATYALDNYEYEFPVLTYSGSTVRIYHDDYAVNSTIHFVTLQQDNVAVKWKAALPSTSNPFRKISNYLDALAMKENMGRILETVKTFLSRDENLYGIKIVEEKVKDTILIARKWTSSSYPSTEMIYQMIGSLQKYIEVQKAIETNHPMLHVLEDKGVFKNMVAIPVNKELQETDSFVVKKMIPGKILTTEVKGGPYTSRATMKQLEFYIDDHKKTSPAIPFESLITNRMKEKDSASWVTKVYYPVY